MPREEVSFPGQGPTQLAPKMRPEWAMVESLGTVSVRRCGLKAPRATGSQQALRTQLPSASETWVGSN